VVVDLRDVVVQLADGVVQGGGSFCSPDSCAKLTSNGLVDPPPSAVASTITTTIATAAAPPPTHQRFGPDNHPAAWARPFVRTGGGVRACASRRLRLLCLPLGIQRLCTRHRRRILLNGSWYPNRSSGTQGS